jgi:hypothetical protein
LPHTKAAQTAAGEAGEQFNSTARDFGVILPPKRRVEGLFLSRREIN